MKTFLVILIAATFAVPSFGKDKNFIYQTGHVTAITTPTGTYTDLVSCVYDTCSGDWIENTQTSYTLTAADGTIYQLEYAGVLDRHNPLRESKGTEIKFRIGTIGKFQYGPPQCRHADHPCVFVPTDNGKESIYSEKGR